MTGIGYDAFNGCNSLESIEIPESVTGIAEYAFYGCKKLTDITIHDSVTYIGGNAFSYCNSLTSINFKGTKGQWNEIQKFKNWDYSTKDYIIHCTDGNIAKGN